MDTFLQPETIGSFLWVIFILIWFISAFSVKKDMRRDRNTFRGFWIRVILIAVVIIVISSGSYTSYIETHGVWPLGEQAIMFLAWLGVLLVFLGIAIALWARFHLGRNWSNRPAIKAGQELVTDGPYQYVRHPIYTGILLAIIGWILISGPIWILGLIGFLVMIIYRIPIEEGFMTELFPDQYMAYKAKTKALIPFVW